MSQNKEKKAWKERLGTTKVRYGSYSAAVSVVVLAILVVVNLIVSNLPGKYTKFDTSDSSYYSIGELTQSIVGSLDMDVTISVLASEEEAKADSILGILAEMLERYQALSDHLQVAYVDPAINPTFASDNGAADASKGSLIVKSEKRSTVVSYSDLYQVDYDYSSYYTTGSPTSTQSYDGESAVTSAIDYVVSDTLPILYQLTGHGERSLPASVEKQVERMNIEKKELNLLTAGGIPEDASSLLIYCPEKDLSEEEADQILAYLQEGGSALVVPTLTGEAHPNFDKIYNNYGMRLTNSLILEGSAEHYYQSPMYLVPEIESHTITSPITERNISVLLGGAQGITISSDIRSSLTVSSLLSTSADSYGKELTGGTVSTAEREEGDASGPFCLAAAATETVGEKTSYLVVISSEALLDETIIERFTVSNADVFLNSLSWMCEHESTISIAPKSMDINTLTMTESQSRFWMILTMGVIPVVLLGCGIGVWAWRRKK
ncbi:Gldg family protein [Hominifimenecus sp. rT4P-3]|uniref:Gldg family protein n=1 Tax=Hominifimenecus sp. rT4P-3 TaxID=3242979 RepID=UPI003DA568EA